MQCYHTTVNTIDAETAAFTTEGFVILRGILSIEEIKCLQSELLGLLIKQKNTKGIIRYRSLPWKEHLPERIDPVSSYSTFFKSLAEDDRFTIRAKKFLQKGEVKHFKDKLIFKCPGQSGYLAHQDQLWWQAFGTQSATCLIAIDDAGKANGGIEFLPGSHQALLATEADPRFLTESDLSSFDNRLWYLPELTAGDAVFFHGQTVHRSHTNLSDTWRRTFFISYCS